MKAQETIIAELKQIVELIPQLRIKYEFDASDNSKNNELFALRCFY